MTSSQASVFHPEDEAVAGDPRVIDQDLNLAESRLRRASTTRLTSAGSATLAAYPSAVPRRLRIALRVSSRPSTVRATPATLAPQAASRVAIAQPIPA